MAPDVPRLVGQDEDAAQTDQGLRGPTETRLSLWDRRGALLNLTFSHTAWRAGRLGTRL